MSPRLFGTDGIRGRALEGALAPLSVARLGRAIADLARERSGDEHPCVVVARDPRASGPALRDALVAGLGLGGARVQDAGALTTPGAAWTGERRGAALTVVVSASHNPPEDNGLKVFEPGARKLDDPGERAIEERFFSLPEIERLPAARATDLPDARSRYLDALALSDRGERLDGLRVVVDAGFGAAAGLASSLLERLGATVTALHDEPRGEKIGVGVGAVFPDKVARATFEKGADLGVAFDGDSDRALFSDHTGQVRDGDDVLFLLGRALAKRNELPGKTLVGTSMTNGGLAAALARSGVSVENVDAVGDRHIAERLRTKGYSLGGEPSGHVIATRWLATGDGLYTALAVLREVRRTRTKLAELCSGFERFPQLLEGEPAPRKPPLDSLPRVREVVSTLSRELESRGGRLVVRYSGTEPLFRVMAEGPSTVDLAGIVRSVREAFRASLEESGRA
ncbi:phosphoglucosamine mutase [bacterium]|nr:phosphoglucosamine mutase [bacterium]